MGSLIRRIIAWWAARGVPQPLGLLLTGFAVLCALVAAVIILGHLFEGSAGP